MTGSSGKTTALAPSVDVQSQVNNIKSYTKLLQLGMQCVSPGLSSDNMDNKMLTTIRMSKNIAREQRQHIEKLGAAGMEDYAEEEVSTGSERSLGNDSMASIASVLTKPPGRFLKRKKVPQPLNIKNGINYSLQGGFGKICVESAPANISNFHRGQNQRSEQHRVLKPRVKYIGKHSWRQISTGRVPGMGSIPMGPPSLMALNPYEPHWYPQSSNSQYLMQMHPYAPQWYPQSFNPQHTIPIHMPIPHPMTAHPRFNIHPQHSALNTVTAHLKFKAATVGTSAKSHTDSNNFVEDKKQNMCESRDLSTSHASKWSPLKERSFTAQDEFFENSAYGNDKPSESDNICTSNVDIDVGTSVTIEPANIHAVSENSANRIKGEISIVNDIFSYEFTSIKDQLDKKMFISICEKVWDESKKLNTTTE